MTKKLGRPREIDPNGDQGGVKTVAVTISRADYNSLKQIAQINDIKISKAVRTAISEYISSKKTSNSPF